MKVRKVMDVNVGYRSFAEKEQNPRIVSRVKFRQFGCLEQWIGDPEAPGTIAVACKIEPRRRFLRDI